MKIRNLGINFQYYKRKLMTYLLGVTLFPKQCLEKCFYIRYSLFSKLSISKRVLLKTISLANNIMFEFVPPKA